MTESSPPSGGFPVPGTGNFPMPSTGGFEFAGDTEPTSSLVRPYSRTGGRTRAKRDLNMETLVATTPHGRQAANSPMMSPEHVAIIQMCRGTISVAEIAAKLTVPLGVARVLISDMVDLGLVAVGASSTSDGDERDPAFLRRVLSGLQRL